MYKQLLIVAALAGIAFAKPESPSWPSDIERSTMDDPDPKLGSYSDTGLWRDFPPSERSSKIGTKFYLYSPGYTDCQTIRYDQLTSIAVTHFGSQYDTKIIIHGFNSESDADWVKKMRKAFKRKGNFNIILVDWRKGAKMHFAGPFDWFGYDQATSNTRVVGDQVGELITALKTNKSKVHLIGHSLGAHISGFASVSAGKVGRISGLDPADPNFQSKPNPAKLDKSDADFVDIIHTDASFFWGLNGYGTSDESGHLDFWPNGGKTQPECKRLGSKINTKRGMERIGDKGDGLSCDHSRAHAYYTESINSDCSFTAKPCRSYKRYLKGLCNTCNGHPCPIMGYRAIEFKNYNYNNLPLFLRTNSKPPYCSKLTKV